MNHVEGLCLHQEGGFAEPNWADKGCFWMSHRQAKMCPPNRATGNAGGTEAASVGEREMGQCLRLPWGLSFKRDRLRGRESGQSHSAKGWLLWKEGALLQLPRPWGREVAGRLAGPFRTEYSYWGDGTLNCSKAPTRCLGCGDPSLRPLLPATVPCREDGHAPSGQASGDSGGSFLQTCVSSPM